MIVVAGATGLTGGELVRRLSSQGLAVRALVRNPAKATALAALPHVEIAVGDLADNRSLEAVLQGADRAMLISSSAPEMLNLQSNFIAVARRVGVKHIVKLSGIMPERDSPFRFARMHGEIEKRLEDSGVAFTHLRAGEFMPAYFRQVGSIAQGKLFLAMQDAKIACIDIADLAECAAITLTGPGHENRIYQLTGPEALTMTDIAQRLSSVTGKTVEYVNVSPEAAKQARLAGMSPYMADALDELFAERRKGKESQVYPDLVQLLGRPATSFAQFAARNAAIFKGEQEPPRV